MAIWPIENRTTRHMEDQLLTILSSIETSLINSGDVRMVARSRQEALIDEIGWEQDAAFDTTTVQRRCSAPRGPRRLLRLSHL